MFSAKAALSDPRRDLRTRMHLQLAPDVLDVRFGRPWRDRQPRSNGMIRQPLGDQPGHFELTVSEWQPRTRGLTQESEHRAQHPCPVPVVEKVAGTRQREQRCTRDQRGYFLPELESCGPVALTVHDR